MIATQEIVDEILRLKAETGTILLAHYYQDDDIQDIADFIGDSLDLARRAQQVTEQRILFAGVHFMAETAKILNPDKVVLVPDLAAGCSLADSCPPEAFARFVAAHPGHAIISYINCSAAIKAMSDVICTSSNAVDIVGSFPADQPLIFAPDRYLGSWVAKQAARPLVLWNGTCIVHETFSLRHLLELKQRHSQARVVAHPECPEGILNEADFVGSTKKIIQYVVDSPADTFIVVTEPGIIHQMRRLAPGKTFLPALAEDESCSCNKCPHMRLNTMEKILSALRTGEPQIQLDEKTRLAARSSLLAMLERS
jgi:quinolinate synthase